MKIDFWGVRGSIPAPGPETIRYGGNTSCVSVVTASGHLIIIDMGTGLIRLGGALLRGDFDAGGDFGAGAGAATVLLSHAHWDHIQGFPFFPPVFIPGNRLRVLGNADSSGRLEGILEGQMNPHFSPIYTLKNLGADIEFESAEESFEVEGVQVRTCRNPHGSGDALAFRLEEDGKSFVYASDAGYPPGQVPQASIDLYRGANVLVHDTTYTPGDLEPRRNRGLSSIDDAVRAAVAAQVERLVMFHYDQDYSDEQVDALAAACRQGLDDAGGEAIELEAAREGMTIEL